MPTHESPIDLARIAALEEARQARGLAEIADECMTFAGGIAGRAVPGAWTNNVVGAGLSGPVSRGEVEKLVAWYASRGIEPRVELCPYVDPTLTTELELAGFVLRGFETVFFRHLDAGREVSAVHAAPPALRIRRVRADDPVEVSSFSRVAVSGFFPAEEEIPDEFLELSRRAARHPRTVAMIAELDGAIVGAGSCEVSGEVVALFGLSVLPEFRRRGIQQALIAARLNHAAAQGARFATIGGKPGAGTERNVLRMGFAVAYTRAVVCRPGPGLVAMAG